MAYLVAMQSHVFSSFARMPKTLWMIVIKGRHTVEIIQVPPPCIGERHWPRIEQQLDSSPIKIGPDRPWKNMRKYPHENPIVRLTKHCIEMSCSVCKSKQHTKRKCHDKDRVVEPILKRPKGRPRKDGAPPSSSQVGPLLDHLDTITQHTRIGRCGRIIRGGRGSKGGKRNVDSNVRSLNYLYSLKYW